jgi:hypothetical protein
LCPREAQPKQIRLTLIGFTNLITLPSPQDLPLGEDVILTRNEEESAFSGDVHS